MPIQLSPGVNVTEIDLTTIVPAVATSTGAIAGLFRWGPVGERRFVDTETKLVAEFGKPSNYNAETWFTTANFLNYTNSLYISRAANTTGPTPTLSFTATSGNTVLTTTGNTQVLSIGMYVTQSSDATIVVAGKTVAIDSVNSTAIVLSDAALATGTVQLYFAHTQTSYSAVALEEGGVVANLVNQIVKNENDYIHKDGTFDTDVTYIAKYPGALGNSLRVSVCDTSASYTSNIAVDSIDFTIGSNSADVVCTNSTAFSDSVAINDYILAGNSSIGLQYLQVTAIATPNATSATVSFQDPYRLHTNYVSNTVQRFWEFFNAVGEAPGQSDYVRFNGNTAANDELHVVVVDNNGDFTGVPGQILEVYKGLSRATDAKNNDTSINYYKDVINQSSRYVWWANDRGDAASANAMSVTTATTTEPGNYALTLGADGFDEANTSAFSVIAGAYDLFVSPEDIDISLIMQGRPLGGSTVENGITVSNFQLSNYIIDNICAVRKDCVAFVSPDKATTINNFGMEADTLVAWRDAISDSSYAVMDSGYKYQYDRYNDIYRWIPLNGDIAGLCARTDQTNDAWWSPAGFNRGQIKNVIKLAYNPRKAERDILYPNGINPVVAFPGQGTILYGDKTLQAKPSAFDRINVRRLFIVLEKAISRAAKYSLFEFNDSFTRAQFKNLVVPYLRSVQGRRGITDFLVVCDDTNNTPQIIDSNQFVGDIYIKPARSINFIQLNFIAVGTGVQFSEVVGKF
mgnify:FL=1